MEKKTVEYNGKHYESIPTCAGAEGCKGCCWLYFYEDGEVCCGSPRDTFMFDNCAIKGREFKWVEVKSV